MKSLTCFFVCVTCAVVSCRSIEAQEPRTIKVPTEIVRQLAANEELDEVVKDRHLGDLSKYLTAYQINLSRDGSPQLVVHGINDICGANNCYTWIFQKERSGYRMLLDAGFIQQIEPQRTYTNGYRDVFGAMHGSAWDSDLTLYKFDGRRYRRAGCFSRTYRYKDKRGVMRESKRPQITRARCESDQ